MLLSRFSKHKIQRSNIEEFPAEDYSKFKHGAGSIGKRFGIEMAKVFSELHHNSLEENIVIYSSPFDVIPTATMSMAKAFFEELVRANKSCTFGKVSRKVSYTVDYARLSSEEREELIGKDNFYFATLPDPNSILIFLDDIRISGSHERVLISAIKTANIQNTFHLGYYGILDDQSLSPDIEAKLNNEFVKDFSSMVEVMNGDDFEWSTRIIKRILSAEFSNWREFRNHLSENKWIEFNSLAERNGYDKIDLYQEALDFFRASCAEENYAS